MHHQRSSRYLLLTILVAIVPPVLVSSTTVQDLWLKARLVTAYTLDGHLDPLSIQVDVRAGKASLDGEVVSARQRQRAADIAEEITGTKLLHNRIHVQKTRRASRPGKLSRTGRTTVPRPDGMRFQKESTGAA